MNLLGSLRAQEEHGIPTTAQQKENSPKFPVLSFFFASESQDREQKAESNCGNAWGKQQWTQSAPLPTPDSKREQKLGQKSPKREQKFLCCFIHP